MWCLYLGKKGALEHTRLKLLTWQLSKWLTKNTITTNAANFKLSQQQYLALSSLGLVK
jgi:hypothetical protein